MYGNGGLEADIPMKFKKNYNRNNNKIKGHILKDQLLEFETCK